MAFRLLVALLCIGAASTATVPSAATANDTRYWLSAAESFVQQQLNAQPNRAVARNVILAIGSGMSTTTLAAARVHIGGEEQQLSFETFPGVGQLRTYCVDQQIADEACTATALFAGTKANQGTVGVTAAVPRAQCGHEFAENVVSLAAEAQRVGKWVGLVTTGRVTAPSVAALYAHSADAEWETDASVRKAGCSPLTVPDIATQLVHGPVGAQMRVILGGGARQFRDQSTLDERGVRNARTDGRDLVGEWTASKYGLNASYVSNRDNLEAVNGAETEFLFGLFANDVLPTSLEVAQVTELAARPPPTLEQMTLKALDVLQRNEGGYLLVVVNGHIDEAHHLNRARIALDETAVLHRAVQVAKERTQVEDTLLVVTADHSHTMTYSGYAVSGAIFVYPAMP